MILERARQAMKGVVGEMALSLEAKRPVPRARMESWVKRLRAAADELEVMLRGPKPEPKKEKKSGRT